MHLVPGGIDRIQEFGGYSVLQKHTDKEFIMNE
jgi:hypothetical protein